MARPRKDAGPPMDEPQPARTVFRARWAIHHGDRTFAPGEEVSGLDAESLARFVESGVLEEATHAG